MSELKLPNRFTSAELKDAVDEAFTNGREAGRREVYALIAAQHWLDPRGDCIFCGFTQDERTDEDHNDDCLRRCARAAVDAAKER